MASGVPFVKLMIQIPCLDEEATLPAVLADLPREIEGIDVIEVVVIDDGSSDRTSEVAREAGADHVIRFAANRGREPDRILDDLYGVRRQLEGWLEEFDDRDLNDTKRYSWASGKALWEIIEENSFGHELEHLPDIEAFAARWLASPESNEYLGASNQNTSGE